ncbi:MAG: hypothetical protein U5Q44_12640 [Dehalococcoidia bacterium]|nr:hypothetical protein [Dehalococcoidia bacterium]
MTYPQTEPVFRARSAVLQYGDGLTDRRWLADSSGFVAYVQDPGAAIDTSRTWFQGRHYAVVGVDGTVRRLPGSEDTNRLGTWYGAAPVPAPDNPDLFSLGRRALLDASTGSTSTPVNLPSEAPGAPRPLGKLGERGDALRLPP